jgi:hypothetical protein
MKLKRYCYDLNVSPKLIKYWKLNLCIHMLMAFGGWKLIRVM